MAQLTHFFVVVQLIGLRGSDGSFQSTTLLAEAETTRSMGALVSASSVVSMTGMPFSTSGSRFISCDTEGNVVSECRDGDVLRADVKVSPLAGLDFSWSSAILAEPELRAY